jgi:predicted dienelactone hydrolase
VTAALAVSAVACADPPRHPHPVGLRFAAYEDEARRNWTDGGNRPLATAIWYPAPDGTREAAWRVSIFRAGWNAPGAPLAVGGTRHPLVLLSHGTGGGAATLSWLAETLAANGYVVAAVNHHGNTAAEPSYQLPGFVVWWDRPRDLSVLIDKLLADPTFGAAIDPARIGVGGFSLGGYTALATVGARLDYAQWRAFCARHPGDPSCTLPPEAPFSMTDVQRLLDHDERVRAAIAHSSDAFGDPRIGAAFVMAPVLGGALTRDSLAAIRVPVRIVVGADDSQAIPDQNARPLAAAIPGATLEVLPDVSHYSFLAPCTLVGRLVARALCRDTVSRDDVHRRVSNEALAFFDEALRVP